MLHLQGDLQTVFDALYELGVIEPMLSINWAVGLQEIEAGSPVLMNAIQIVNRCGRDGNKLKTELTKLSPKSLEVLAMEVAREYADFHTRSELQ